MCINNSIQIRLKCDKIELVLVDYSPKWQDTGTTICFTCFMRLIPSKYSIIIPQDTLLRANKYLQELQFDRTLPGKRLQSLIQKEELKQFQSSDLLGKLLTPKYQIFAESEVVGDGSDWNVD